VSAFCPRALSDSPQVVSTSLREETEDMALITRVSRLFRADMHAVLDRIEEPELLLRQAVREMEDELARDEQRLKAMRMEQTQVHARGEEVARAQQALEQELDVCFASDEQELARGVVRRKLESERLAAVLARRAQMLEESSASLAAQVEENRTRLESMRQKAEILAEESSAMRTGDPWVGQSVVVRQEEVDVALLREKQKRSRT
jgi:phage shock protein A